MNQFIRVSGVGVILAVFGIFVFILLQIYPLFAGAKVSESARFKIDPKPYAFLGSDEWAEKPFLVDADGVIYFFDLTSKAAPQKAAWDKPDDFKSTAFGYDDRKQEMLYGSSDGRILPVQIHYEPVFENDRRVIQASVLGGKSIDTGLHQPIQMIRSGHGDRGKLVLIVSEGSSSPQITAMTLTQKKTLGGVGKLTRGDVFVLTEQVQGRPTALEVNGAADTALVATDRGEIYHFYFDGKQMELRQVFKPFEDRPDPGIRSMNFLLGEGSLFVVNPDGTNRIYGLMRSGGKGERLFGMTKKFPDLPVDGPIFFSRSLRNKAFLAASGAKVSLRYGTTQKVRWEKELDFKIQRAVINPKYNRIFLLGEAGEFVAYDLHDPHPEAGFEAFFGKIWYEGYDRPTYDWQSTGGSDEFEPKLSMIPLIVGSLKGTLYALLFAFPIAILAAIYTSQFAHPNLRHQVKPVMETMASLPSVILGFLAALWLAPILETRVPSFLCVVVFLPAAALGAGIVWSFLPESVRRFVPPGWEVILLVPVLAVAGALAWNFGGVVEKIFFTVSDPETGAKIADFRRWWTHTTGLPFEQRNSLIVGFVMGFAVIPIIFSISEDALSNVPTALRSASLALGASRWQTALKVVLPTASPGILSAVMIGFGRAVGETMIVVMATGNTPIMDWNIFSGMRTLSANIAVELPEAPMHSTLYRALYLGAFLLFLFTFSLNTLAELLREKLREKYKTV